MCKWRVTALPQDSRKAFTNILVSLIEKSPDPKLLKVLTKIVDDWVKPKVSHISESLLLVLQALKARIVPY